MADPGISEPGARSQRVKFLRSEIFYTPSQIRYVFLVKVDNNMQILNIACWQQLSYYVYYAVKIYKNKPPNTQMEKGVCVRRSWIRPCSVTPTKRLDIDLKDMADGSHFLWHFRFRGCVSLESALYKINVGCKWTF